MPPLDTAHAGLAAAERLRDLVDAWSTGRTLDSESLGWLMQGLGQYLGAASDGLKLEDALNMSVPHGSVPWWLVRSRAERDRLIRELAATFNGPPWSRAQAVAEALRHYQSTGWTHDRSRGVPMTSDPRRKTMFNIFSAEDRPPPTRVRRIYDILIA